jgi:hypothetical protein
MGKNGLRVSIFHEEGNKRSVKELPITLTLYDGSKQNKISRTVPIVAQTRLDGTKGSVFAYNMQVNLYH